MGASMLIPSFWAMADNCVAVAFIKAMLAGKLYRICKRQGKIFLYLRDGTIFTFTDAQLKKINLGNGIHYRRRSTVKKIKRDVEVLFASLVYQLQLHGYAAKGVTQAAAKKLLVQGIETKFIHQWLGVIQRRYSFKSGRKNLPAALLFNAKHITFASGRYFDQEGKAVPLTDAEQFPYGVPTAYYILQ